MPRYAPLVGDCDEHARSCAAYLCFHDPDGDGQAPPVTVARLSEASGLHSATVVRHLNHAIEEGWLVKLKPRGSKDRHLYPAFPTHIEALADESQRMLDSTTEPVFDANGGHPIQLH